MCRRVWTFAERTCHTSFCRYFFDLTQVSEGAFKVKVLTALFTDEIKKVKPSIYV